MTELAAAFIATFAVVRGWRYALDLVTSWHS
jgi:hypothetical protein